MQVCMYLMCVCMCITYVCTFVCMSTYVFSAHVLFVCNFTTHKFSCIPSNRECSVRIYKILTANDA